MSGVVLGPEQEDGSMSGSIVSYSIEDADGNEVVGYVYDAGEYDQAKAVAAQLCARVIEHEYEWVDSSMVDDFTTPDESVRRIVYETGEDGESDPCERVGSWGDRDYAGKRAFVSAGKMPTIYLFEDEVLEDVPASDD